MKQLFPRAFFAALLTIPVLLAGIGVNASPIRNGLETRFKSDDISSTGQNSLEELSNCVAETGKLNAYYLIDHSGSWIGVSNGNPPTDPELKRIPILQRSLEQLAELASGSNPFDVNVAFGYFGSEGPSSNDYGSDWVSVNIDNLSELANGVEKAINRENLKFTNWEAGLQDARASIKGKDGCNVIIWLTDGEIDLAAWTSDADAQPTIDKLCAPEGLLQQIRNDGTTVVGVYLNPREPSGRAAWMQPLVEGTGNNKTCGDGAAVTKGVFINAKTISDLAFEFIRIGERIRGAGENPIGQDGRFTISEGTTSFKIISTAPSDEISLLSPTGIFPEDSVKRETTGGVTELTVRLRDKNDLGEWQLKGAESARNLLFLFIEFGIYSSPLYVNESRTDGRIFVSINYANQKIQKGVKYEDTIFVADGEGIHHEAEYTGGKTTVEIPVSNPKDLGEITYSFQQKGKSSSDKLMKIDYSKFPSLTNENDFGIVRGYNEPAKGTVKVFGPISGDGAVCFTDGELSSKNVVTDTAKRARTWTISGTNLDSNGCISVGQSESTSVNLEAQPSDSVDAKEVALALPVFVRNASGEVLSDDGENGVHLNFKTHLDTNPWLRLLLITLLVLLAVLIPLLVMYLINLFTTKVEHGNDLVRAIIPVNVSLKGESILAQKDLTGEFDTELSSVANPQESFKMRPPQEDAKTIKDLEIGTFRAVVPIMPLISPWYEVEANDGYIVLSGMVPAKRQEKRFRNGARAPFNGQLSRTWLMVAKKEDLLAPEDGLLPARMVIFDKRGRGGAERARQRLAEVQHEAKLAPRLTSLAKDLQSSSDQDASKTKIKGRYQEEGALSIPVAPGRGPNTPPPPPPGYGSGPNTPPPPPPGRGPNTPPPPPGRGPI